MGRKAKIKQQKKTQEPLTSPTEDTTNSNNYIKHMNKQGYSLKTITHSPELPDRKIEPQI